MEIYKDLLKQYEDKLVELGKVETKVQSLEKEVEELKAKSLEQKKLLKEKSEQIVEMSTGMEKIKVSGGYTGREDELAKELENKNKLMEKLVSNVKSLVEEKKSL